MTNKDKPHFVNALDAQDEEKEAIKQARIALAKDGVYYPLVDSTLSHIENYDRLCKYNDQESAMIVKLKRMPSGPRPIEFDSTNTKWNGYE